MNQLKESKTYGKQLEGDKFLLSVPTPSQCYSLITYYTIHRHKENFRQQEEKLRAEHQKDKENITALTNKVSDAEKELSIRPPVTFENLLDKIG